MKLPEMFEVNNVAEGYRVCGTCSRTKPVEDFYKDGKDHEGKVKYRRDCKDCYKSTRIKESKLKEREHKHAS